MVKKKYLLSQVGNMQQLMYARPLTYEEGRARGLKAYQVKNGPLEWRINAWILQRRPFADIISVFCQSRG